MQYPMHLIIHFPEELGLADRPFDKILSEGEGRGGEGKCACAGEEHLPTLHPFSRHAFCTHDRGMKLTAL